MENIFKKVLGILSECLRAADSRIDWIPLDLVIFSPNLYFSPLTNPASLFLQEIYSSLRVVWSRRIIVLLTIT